MVRDQRTRLLTSAHLMAGRGGRRLTREGRGGSHVLWGVPDRTRRWEVSEDVSLGGTHSTAGRWGTALHTAGRGIPRCAGHSPGRDTGRAMGHLSTVKQSHSRLFSGRVTVRSEVLKSSCGTMQEQSEVKRGGEGRVPAGDHPLTWTVRWRWAGGVGLEEEVCGLSFGALIVSLVSGALCSLVAAS